MIKVIPTPHHYTQEEGVFNMQKGFSISYPDSLKSECDNLVTFLDKLHLAPSKDSLNSIDFVECKGLAREGYLINISNNAIKISASTPTGCLYAVSTLKQLVVSYDAVIPCFQIEDKPKFNYRGYMLDVGRYFFPVEDVMRLLDLMALHKLNYFHWHLTEDQGWRVEIDKYPLLTEKGSRRSHTNFNMREHKGYYTKADIKRVVDYAHSLHIKVIPEIDMPGHMQAALAAYPELGCFERKLPVATHWGIKHDILCGGKKEVRQFVKDVIDEIVEMFPDKFIHIGADEADKRRWELCPNCRREMEQKHLKNMNELQADFINEINSYIRSKGYTTIMWNEDEVSGKIAKDIIWMAWNVDKSKHEMLYNEMESGRVIINASSEPNYLDLPYSWNPLKRVYNEETSFVKDHERLIGMEAPLWTEFVPNMKKAYKMTFPRLGAIAEVAWSNTRDYDDFVKRMDSYYDILRLYGVYNLPKIAHTNPTGVRKICSKIWWERRQLCWHGLHNLIDDANVKRMAKKREKKSKQSM